MVTAIWLYSDNYSTVVDRVSATDPDETRVWLRQRLDEPALGRIQLATAWTLKNDPVRWRGYIRDAIIDPAIGGYVLALGQVRRPALLRQVFAAGSRTPAWRRP